jgi:uncharacterized delta-60 repeat protein
MSFMLLGILNSQAAGGGLTYWLATLGGAAADEGYGVATDSSGKVYYVARQSSQGGGSYDWYVAQSDSAGAVQWQRTLGSSGFEEVGKGSLTLDSSGNSYIAGNDASGAERVPALAKYNSSGVIQWQRKLTGGGSAGSGGSAIDSSGDIYLSSRVYVSAIYKASLAKYNSSGTLQWQRGTNGTDQSSFDSVAVDSSDNVYGFGRTTDAGAGSDDFLIIKYNSSGTVQWQRVLGGASSEFAGGIVIDSSDNLYVTGYTSSQGPGSSSGFIAKYNSSGTVQWQRTLGNSSSNYLYGVALDSENNVYVSGYASISSKNDMVFAKYNSSGTIQWQRRITSTGTDNDIGYGIHVDSADTLYVIGQTNNTGVGSADILIAKLPSDGSLTGTYELDGVNMTYGASSLTAATATLTAATSSIALETSSYTSATATMTDAAASFTSHLVEIPA